MNCREIYRSSQLLAYLTGIHPQPNKAIVGKNAFAHEAGIHQDGVLKERTTYEILTPELIGVPESRLVLGKHSGRAALERRCRALGYELSEEELDRVYRLFKLLCDRKKTVLDEDLISILHHGAMEDVPQVYRLRGLQVVCGEGCAVARVRLAHGAFGALAFGIGSSAVAHVLATQCLLQRRPRAMEVRVTGRLPRGVVAKDLALAVVARLGPGGGAGHVFEYTGEAVRALDMEGRMTLCNMSIEAGARAGLVAPDDVTFAYLAGRPCAPRGRAWDAAVAVWRRLATDEGASYDAVVELDASRLAPMVTYGTHPGMGLPIDGRVPDPRSVPDPQERAALERALRYMDLRPGQPILGQRVDVVFVGSCTDARLSDLRAAAAVLCGRRVADGVRMLVVPGSQEVKPQAEAEGLVEVFRRAGAEWREPGCSMCIPMNGDELAPGQYAVSTSNRDFEGRQGRGGRTFLASPLTAAASAVGGPIAALEDGDVVVFHIPARRLDVELDDAELRRRLAAWRPPPRYATGVLAEYARLVPSASTGAVTG